MMKALLDAVLMQMTLIFVALSSVVVDEGGGEKTVLLVGLGRGFL